jgi:hypothetical protein
VIASLALVAQIFNLLYRRISFGKGLVVSQRSGIQIRETAECNSALPGLLLPHATFLHIVRA